MTPRRILIALLLLAGLLSPAIASETPRLEIARHHGIPDRPEPVDGTVHVRLDRELDAFPRHFNEIGVRRIVLEFEAQPGTRGKFSAVWNGGSKGPDRFAVVVDGIPSGSSRLADTPRYPYRWYRDEFQVRLGPGETHRIEILPIDGFQSELEFTAFCFDAPDSPPYRAPCYESLASRREYEMRLGERGVFLESPYLTIAAPATLARETKALSAFLEKAHEELRSLYDLDPTFRISVEHFPKGHERGWGGISGRGTIGYPLESLLRFKELKTRDVRGFAGYTEEMSHAFKAVYRCGGTSEALGVAVQEDLVRRLVKKGIADRFWLSRHRQWEEAHAAYLEAGKTNPDTKRFPPDVFLTRILNKLFRDLRTEYGEGFWPDFFRMIRQMDSPFHRAKKEERLGIYADIFSVMFGRDMRREFLEFGLKIEAKPTSRKPVEEE